MKETKFNANLPDEEVIVKIASCQKCDGVVRVAVKHTMDTISKNSFAKEVLEYNMKVSELPLIEYRTQKPKWCDCI